MTELLPADAPLRSPRRHADIPPVSDQVARLGVGEESFDRHLRRQPIENLHRFAMVQDQHTPARGQGPTEVVQALVEEDKMRWIKLLGAVKLLFLDKEAEHRPVHGRLGQRFMVFKAKVALEPNEVDRSSPHAVFPSFCRLRSRRPVRQASLQ